MSHRLVLFISKVSLFVIMGLMIFPIISNALNVYVPSSITYNPATGRVTGTVYSYESQIRVDFRNRFGGLLNTVGTYSPDSVVNGYEPTMKINQFNIDAITGTNYNPQTINIETKTYNDFDKISEASGIYSYFGESGILKNFVIGLPETMYTGVNNVPFTQYIGGSTAYYGNPFQKEGYTYMGGFDIKPCQITSSNPAIASISDYGQITTRAPGSTIITAVCNGISRSQDIKVMEGSYKGLTMPFPFDVYVKGYDNNYFMVNAYDQNGVPQDVTQYASYSYSKNSILSIDPANHKAIATAEGYTVITATYKDLTASTPVMVVGNSDPNIAYTAYSTNTQATLMNKNFDAGTTIRPELLAYKLDKQAYTDVTSEAIFVLEDDNKGVVNRDHSITLTTSGPITIIAIYKNHYEKLYVNPLKLTSVKFSADRYTVNAGENLDTVLLATYSDMTKKDVTNAAHYTTSNPNVVKINQNGVITGNKPGIAQIAAVYLSNDGGFYTNTEVEVRPAPGPVDTVSPEWPANTTTSATDITSSSATLHWTAGTDNVGITGYKLYTVSNSTYSELVSISGTTTRYNLTKLSSNTDYRYALKAVDAAGNTSEYSPFIDIHTSASVGGGGGGGGGPTGPTESFKWEIVNKNGAIRVTSSITPDQLKKLVEDQTKSGNNEIPIDLKTSADGYDFQMNAGQINEITNKQEDAILVFNTTVGTARIPFDVLQEALKANGGKDWMNLRISVDKLPLADQQNLQKMIASNGGESVGQALSYELSLLNDSNSLITTIDSFSEFVGHVILLPKDFKLNPGEKLNGAVWDPASRTLISVPMTVTLDKDGKPASATLWKKGNSIYTVYKSQKQFADVKEDYFAKDDIETLAASNVIQGFEDGSFRADASVTRAEFATLLVRGLGMKIVSSIDKGFSDVSDADWFSQAVYTAVGAGLISGYEDETFRPAQSITHQEAITMISNALKFINAATKLNDSERARYAQRMSELSLQVDEWASDAVAMALKRNILNASNGFSFEKDAKTTRGQTALLINKLLQNAAWPK
ncbi:hypothetical protein GQF01_00875 [Paenibacillus sp. 5J-6]|uniref:Uncharacterized protein n=1 Tax=Paenibacillus silvestris TaxID=2606219 RepID=A0A6L8URQ5_9BACL|nr:S-layer homology domain-containing protein [Paenibacillus silvestris]MZQ80708.1 hypothetical protein [Paenibacillus silvestris]